MFMEELHYELTKERAPKGKPKIKVQAEKPFLKKPRQGMMKRSQDGWGEKNINTQRKGSKKRPAWYHENAHAGGRKPENHPGELAKSVKEHIVDSNPGTNL